ncbi:MAG: MFS transporter [Burkholderiales bacterium]
MISLSRFASLLAHADVRQSFANSFLGRLPIGIAGLAILLLVQSLEQSYATAGLVAACYVGGLASASPLLGRLIDRIGPRPVLAACAIVYPAALSLLIVTAHAGYTTTYGVLFAALAGASFPPVTACQRAWLRQRLGDDPLFTAALSLDALIVELVFIIGPLLVALLVAVASPAAAVGAAAVCGLAGSLQFTRAQALRTWRVVARESGPLLGPLGEQRFPVLLFLITCYATVFGIVEIGVTAFARETGSPALAGVLLAVMSIGSVLGALVYGSRHWHQPLVHQFSYSLAVMGAGILPLALATQPTLFGLWCAVAGIAMTPTLIVQSTLVARTVRVEFATEGFTWSATALLAGVSLGLAVGGLLLESGNVARLFWLAALVSVLAGLLSRGLLRAPA